MAALSKFCHTHRHCSYFVIVAVSVCVFRLTCRYEVKFQNGQECGGAYIKLLSHQDKLDLVGCCHIAYLTYSFAVFCDRINFLSVCHLSQFTVTVLAQFKGNES